MNIFRRRKRNDDFEPPDSMPRDIQMTIMATGEHYPLVPVYDHIDDFGITMWKVGLHPDVDGDVFITEGQGQIALGAKVLPGRCAMAIGFTREDDGRVRIMRHDELNNDD